MFNGINTQNSQVKTPDNRREIGPVQQSMEPSDDVRGPGDRVTLHKGPVEPAIYGIPKRAEIAGSEYSLLQELLLKMLEEQGVTTHIASGEPSLDFRNLTPAQAQELISEDGYLGVEQTSDRIVQFAISMAGDDPKNLDKIRASIDKGVKMASKALGGSLPEISMKTYEAVMEKLDDWAESFDS